MIQSGLSPACKHLLDQEQALFQAAYQKYYLPGETKAPEIGAPYLLHQPESREAVLLIHGLMAAPYEVRQWANALFAQGDTVYAPRLAGHGTSAVDLAGQNFANWVDSVERGYDILSHCAQRIMVAGFSTGAGLALHQAIVHPHRYQAVISVSAPLRFTGLSARLSETMERWNRTAGFFHLYAPQKPFAVNHPDNPEINYRRCPIHAFNQVKSLMRTVYQGLPAVDIPALIIQGSKDPKVSPAAGKMIFHRLRTRDKVYIEIDHHLHGIVRNEVGVRVFTAVNDFIARLERTA